MGWDIQSFELFTRVLGEVALISIIYGSICRSELAGRYQQAVHGALFGIASIIAMSFPIAFSETVKIDGHLMMLAHGAAFGGPITFIISAVISLAYRTAANGDFNAKWLIGTAVVGALGLCWNGFVRPRGGLALWSLVLLGVIDSLQVLLFFLLPYEVAISMIMRTLPVALIISIMGAVLMGKFIEREMRQISVEAQLLQQAQTDALTTLANRRAFETAIETLEKSRCSAATMVLDIDHFKTFNDTYGHHAGDAVLRAVAGTIATTLGARGRVFRTGGEEFSVLVTGVGQAAAMPLAEQIRLAVAELRLLGFGQPVTISIGVAQIDTTSSAMQAIQQADRAVYIAKASGRNRTIAASTLGSFDGHDYALSSAA